MGKAGEQQGPWCLLLVLLVLLVAANAAAAAEDKASKDRDDCAQQLAGLATCLQYVQGEAKAPTPDCCTGLKQVLQTNKKCLCVIVRDRNDPDLGLNINATLALSLPNVCKASADISKCPALLNMPSNSTEAQVFFQFARSANAAAPTPAQVNGKASNTTGNGKSSSGCCSRDRERLWGSTGFIIAILLWCFM